MGGARVARRGRVLTQRRAPQDGATPLHFASFHGHPEVVKLLLKAGADKNAPSTVREGILGGGLGAHTMHVFRSGGRTQAAGWRRADKDCATVQYSLGGNCFDGP